MSLFFRSGAVAIALVSLAGTVQAQSGSARFPLFSRPSQIVTKSKAIDDGFSREIVLKLSSNAERLSQDYPDTLMQVAESVHLIPHIGFLRVRLKAGVDIPAALSRLRTLPQFSGVHPARRISIVSVPNDSYISSQYALTRMNVFPAWDLWRPLTEPNKPIIVAGVDTGVLGTHIDLAAKMLRDTSGNIIGYDATTHKPSNGFGEHWHGTHTAGIMVATINNGTGVAGIGGWTGEAGVVDTTSIRLMPIRVLDASGSGGDVEVAEGIVWATDHGARVINMSLGANDAGLGSTVDNPMYDATEYAIAQGVTVVCAAGNNGRDEAFYPASYPGTLSVAATVNNSIDSLAGFSNRGTRVNVSAPGEGIISTYNNGGYANASGTSMAAPQVAGLVALLLAQNPMLSQTRVRSIVINTVRPYGASSLISPTGGPVDALRAMNATLATLATINGTITLQGATASAQVLTLNFASTDGSLPFTKTVTLTSQSSGSAIATFTLPRVLPKVYTIRLKTPQHLAKAITFDATAGGALSLTSLLLAGDVNNDNAVDFGDLSKMLQSYNAFIGDPLYFPAADLNNDGSVDFGDLSLMLQNYNTIGD